jgi:hypothetical protein
LPIRSPTNRTRISDKCSLSFDSKLGLQSGSISSANACSPSSGIVGGTNPNPSLHLAELTELTELTDHRVGRLEVAVQYATAWAYDGAHGEHVAAE